MMRQPQASLPINPRPTPVKVAVWERTGVVQGVPPPGSQRETISSVEPPVCCEPTAKAEEPLPGTQTPA